MDLQHQSLDGKFAISGLIRPRNSREPSSTWAAASLSPSLGTEFEVEAAAIVVPSIGLGAASGCGGVGCRSQRRRKTRKKAGRGRT